MPKIFMYWNLHKHCWSLRAMQGALKGRVVAHCTQVELAHCLFKVSEAGRQRVLRERSKNVHAGVVGDLMRASGMFLLAGVELSTLIELPKEGKAIRYNPYLMSQFQLTDTAEPIFKADWLIASARTVLVAPPLTNPTTHV